MESKIYLFRDKSDYIKKISDDNIINVTGSVGSGSLLMVGNIEIILIILLLVLIVYLLIWILIQ